MEGYPPDGSYQVPEYRTKMEELGSFVSNEYGEPSNQTNIVSNPPHQMMNANDFNTNAGHPPYINSSASLVNPNQASGLVYFNGHEERGNQTNMMPNSSHPMMNLSTFNTNGGHLCHQYHPPYTNSSASLVNPNPAPGLVYFNGHEERGNQTNMALNLSHQMKDTSTFGSSATQPHPVRANPTTDYFTGTQCQNRAQMAAQSSSIESIDGKPKDPRGCRRIPKPENVSDPFMRIIYETCFPGYIGTNGTKRKERNSNVTDEEKKKAKRENRSNFETRWRKYEENLKDFLPKKQLEHQAILSNHEIYRTKRRTLLDQFKANRDKAYFILLDLKYMTLKETSLLSDVENKELEQLLKSVPTFTLGGKMANNAINPQQQSESLNLAKDRDGIEKTNSTTNDDSLASSHAGNGRKKNQKYNDTEKERKRKADCIAAQKSRDKKKNGLKELEYRTRTEMLQIIAGEYLESTLEEMYNETLNKARGYISPLIAWIVYFMNNVKEPLPFARVAMINADIADFKQAYDL